MYIFKWWIFSIVMLVLGFFNILSFHYVTCPRWLKSLLQGTNRDPDPPVVVQLKAHHLRCGKWASQIWLDTSSSVISHQSSDFSHHDVILVIFIIRHWQVRHCTWAIEQNGTPADSVQCLALSVQQAKHSISKPATPLKRAIVWTFRPWSFESFLCIWSAEPKQSSRDSLLSLRNSHLFSRVPKGGDKLCQIMSNHFRPWSSSFHCIARCHLSLCCNIKFTPCVPYVCLRILVVLSLHMVSCKVLFWVYAPIIHPYTSWRFASHVSNLSPACLESSSPTGS